MVEKRRYFCQMNSQHVSVRVPHPPTLEQIGDRKTLDGHPDEQFESMPTRLTANLLKLLLRGDGPLT